jgi:uncharacterized protein
MRYSFITAFILLQLVSKAQSVNQKGISFINLFFEKRHSEIITFFSEDAKKEISIGNLEKIEQAVTSQLGKYLQHISINLESNEGDSIGYYYSKFEKDKLDIKIVFNKKNEIIGFFFIPHKLFEKIGSKNEYSVQSDIIILPGTLLIADSNNKKILSIFIHGSGPLDRDETIYENKPFRDIANGLAEYGISSYRFDKRSKISPELFSNDTFTIDDEVTTDIINLVNHFRANGKFKNYRIVLIGHSLGGMMLPKILEKIEISGAVFMAANARPLEVLLLEQYNYLYKLQHTVKLKLEINKLKRQIDYFNSNNFTKNSPKEYLPLNLPFTYWNSLKNYDQLKSIKNYNASLLILQGENDYQVKMKDFNLWKQELRNNRQAKFISYPHLNHLFMKVDGKSKPSDYQTLGKVSSIVIKDIANWMITQLNEK